MPLRGASAKSPFQFASIPGWLQTATPQSETFSLIFQPGGRLSATIVTDCPLDFPLVATLRGEVLDALAPFFLCLEPYAARA